MSDTPGFYGVYLFVEDMARTLDFYRRLGLKITEISDIFARADLANGGCLEFGAAELTRSYDPHWQKPEGASTNTLGFELASREAVDAMYEELTRAGFRGHLPPCDPPWGSRFALLDDPNGNVVGLHSPRSRAHEAR